MKSLKGVLVNLWKSLRALSSFHTLMMLLRRALSFSCSTSRNWRVCLTIQEETKNKFKRDETTIINITEVEVIGSFLTSLPVCTPLSSAGSPDSEPLLCVAPAYYESCSSSCSTIHTRTFRMSLKNRRLRTGSLVLLAHFWVTLSVRSRVRFLCCLVRCWSYSWARRAASTCHGWRENDGRRWGQIHLHPSGSLPGGCLFQLCRGSHAWSSEPGTEQTTLETPCHYANIQLLCIISFQK